MTTEPKLTDEQVEFAAKFTGCANTWGYNYRRARTYFDKPEGREAVMDRAVEEGWKEFHFNLGVDSIWSCYVRKYAKTKIGGHGPTRFIALVNALMEARER